MWTFEGRFVAVDGEYAVKTGEGHSGFCVYQTQTLIGNPLTEMGVVHFVVVAGESLYTSGEGRSGSCVYQPDCLRGSDEVGCFQIYHSRNQISKARITSRLAVVDRSPM